MNDELNEAINRLSWSQCRGLLATAERQHFRCPRLFGWIGQAMFSTLAAERPPEFSPAAWQTAEVRSALLCVSGWLQVFAGAPEWHAVRALFNSLADELLVEHVERRIL